MSTAGPAGSLHRLAARIATHVTLFESLLLLLLAAIVLLQVARRLALPYPSMLALAGVGVALLPGAPDFPIDPRTALPLFIAPALMDAAFDFPLTTAKRF